MFTVTKRITLASELEQEQLSLELQKILHKYLAPVVSANHSFIKMNGAGYSGAWQDIEISADLKSHKDCYSLMITYESNPTVLLWIIMIILCIPCLPVVGFLLIITTGEQKTVEHQIRDYLTPEISHVFPYEEKFVPSEGMSKGTWE